MANSNGGLFAITFAESWKIIIFAYCIVIVDF